MASTSIVVGLISDEFQHDLRATPTPADLQTPGLKRVVGGVGGAIVNPPTTACGDERVWNR